MQANEMLLLEHAAQASTITNKQRFSVNLCLLVMVDALRHYEPWYQNKAVRMELGKRS